MNESLGDLSWKMRAQIDSFRKDLAEADRAYQDYRKKWESPVNLRAGTGAPSMTGAPMVAGTAMGSGGLNISGMSNGDVTWRLASAIQETQYRQDNAVGVARSILRRIDKDRGGGSSVDSDYMDSLVEAGRQYKSEFGVTSLSDAPKQSLWKTRVPIQSLIRGTVYGLVVDAVAGMASTQSKYTQNMTLAGNNQGSMARAELQRLVGGLSSVPIIGGVLSNLASPFTTPIETQIQMAERQGAFQDDRYSALSGRAATRMQTQAVNLGPNSVSARLASINAQRVQVTGQFSQESAAARAAWDAAHPVPRQFLNVANAPDFLSVRNPAYAEYLRSQSAFNSQQNSILAGRTGLLDAEAAEAMRQGRFQVATGQAEVSGMRMANAYRPYAAQAQTALLTGRAMTQYYMRNGMSSIDRDMLSTNLERQIEGLRGSQRDIIENYRWGEGRQYNPYLESTLTFQDRNVETQGDAMKSLGDAIRELTQELRKANGGSNN